MEKYIVEEIKAWTKTLAADTWIWMKILAEGGRVLLFGMTYIVIICAVIYGILNFATEQHWVAGIAIAGVTFISLVVLEVVLWKALRSPRWLRMLFPFHKGEPRGLFERFPTVTLAIILIWLVFTAMLVMITFSRNLHQAGVVEYRLPTNTSQVDGGQVPSGELEGKLFSYYGWHLVDVIPAVEVWDIFDKKAPLQADDELAGILVLVFRMVIVFQVIAIVKKLWDFRKQLSSRSTPLPAD